MTEAKRATLHRMIWDAVGRVGLSAPRVADEIMSLAYPATLQAARSEDAERIVRAGLIEIVKPILRAANDDAGQLDLGDIDPSFTALVRPLKSNTYFVEALGEHVALSRLILAPSLLDDARRFMRRKGMENLAEADRLDILYDAVRGAAA